MVIGKTVTYMGRKKRRSAQNTPVVQTTRLGDTESLPGQVAFGRAARRRCGDAGRYAWVVVFHESLSPVSDAFLTKFVIRMNEGWYVF